MPSIDVSPILPNEYPQAASLFVHDYRQLCEQIPALSGRMADAEHVESRLADLFGQCQGLAARQEGQLVGYLGWYILPSFRGTLRICAYVPEWGHSATAQALPQVYQALYNKASTIWSLSHARVHAVTMLANNQAEHDFWFWNGFGLLVVDAIRPMHPLEPATHCELTIRKAGSADAAVLSVLDEEHCDHYTQPPVFMSPHQVSPTCAEDWLYFLEQPENAVWMALEGDTPAGFIRFDGLELDGSAILEGESTAFISGAYVRPAYRSRGAATAILDAALRDYAERGYERCALDFESINPEASAFWLRNFQAVGFSLTRVPEWVR